MRRTTMVIAIGLAATLSSFGVARALGVQNHTSNGIQHGCPFDDGCTGATNYYGDSYRMGYNICNPYPSGCSGDSDMDTSYSAIYYAPTGAYRSSGTCNNCPRIDVYYPTGGVAECYYLTTHYVTGPALANHNHWTESAGSAACPV